MLIARAREWADARLALATVLETWGSAPRPVGSHMLVDQDGRFEGSVSGGCVENDVLAAALEAIADRRPRTLRFGIADDAAWRSGLPCGGEIAVLVQPIGEDGFSPALFDHVERMRRAGETARLVTDPDTGATRIATSEEAAGFVNAYPPPKRLLIVGAVQIGQSLARIASELGFAVTVIDPRGAYLTRERFPDAGHDDRWPDEAIAALEPDARTAIVTLSHDPKIDDPALIAALATPASYVGALGSRKSQAARLDRLRAAGLDEAKLERIDGPAGLPIGSRSPAEIALSIAAGMVAALKR
ncbi:MAG: XdhC family protein [Sphingomonadales bacterium]|nr:XdhC family protein [Sphingomonadales bacterium]